MSLLTCEKCGGEMVLRKGKSEFYGCSNFPSCTNTMSEREYTKRLIDKICDYFDEKGIFIYGWGKVCWKCKTKTKVFTYFLDQQVSHNLFNDEDSYVLPIIGLGHIKKLDKYLNKKGYLISKEYSKTMDEVSYANHCTNCKALLGNFYVVTDPHEIMDERFYKQDEFDKRVVETIFLRDAGLSRQDIKEILDGYLLED